MATLRICFLGDSIVHGTKDPTVLGWPGRVCAEAAAEGHDVTHYNLGVRGDTSLTLRRRWRQEAVRRIAPEMPGVLVFSFGLNDTLMDDRGRWRVTPDRTFENATAILTDAVAWLPTLMVGVAPVDDTRMPPQGSGTRQWSTSNARLRSTSDALATVAESAHVPYLDVFGRLIRDERWTKAIAASDSIHPPDGYPLIAELVADWTAWRRLFSQDIDPDRPGGHV